MLSATACNIIKKYSPISDGELMARWDSFQEEYSNMNVTDKELSMMFAGYVIHARKKQDRPTSSAFRTFSKIY